MDTIAHFEEIARNETGAVLRSVPDAETFHTGRYLSKPYYLMYVKELMLRTRLNNQADAYLLFEIGQSDVFLARQIADGLAEEFRHDSFAELDLYSFGISRASLRGLQPLPATKTLITRLYHESKLFGAAANVVWNWYQQWYSDEFDPGILRRASVQWGEEHVYGAQAHVDRHIELINSVAGPESYKVTLFTQVQYLLDTGYSPARMEEALRNRIGATRDYYQAIWDAAAREPLRHVNNA